MDPRAAAPRFRGPVAEPPSIPWRRLGLILLLALGLRCIAIGRAELIGADSYRFLAAASCVEQGDWAGAIADPYHPLTAVLIGGVNSVQNAVLGSPEDYSAERRRRERAGIGISLLFGLLTVWLAMDLARRFFPGISVEGVGILAAVQPYFVRASADIMSDAIHLGLFALALRSGAIALTGTRWGPFGFTGLFVGLAYLARPEGLVLIPAVGAVWLLARPWPWKVFLGRVSVALTALAACILPYSAAIGWRMSGKKDFPELLNSGVGAPPGGGVILGAFDVPILLESTATLFEEWFSTAPELVAAAAVVGAIARVRAAPREVGHWFSGAVVIGMGLLLLRLLHHVGEPGYLSRRHVFMFVFLALPYSAHGIAVVAPGISRIFPARWRPHAFAIVLALVAASVVPKAISAHRADQRMQRVAADHILTHGGPGQRIYSSREKIAYYAAGDLEPLDVTWTPLLLERLADEERAWLVFYRERLGQRIEDLDALLEPLRPSLKLEGRWREPASRRTRHLELYLYVKEPPAAGTR